MPIVCLEWDKTLDMCQWISQVTVLPVIISVTPTHIYKNQAIEIAINSTGTTNNVQYRIDVGSTTVIPYGSFIPVSQMTLLTLQYNDLAAGANTITVYVTDTAGGTNSTTVTIVKEVFYRLTADRTMLGIDGGYKQNNISLNGQAKHKVKTTISPGKIDNKFTVPFNKFTNTVKVN